MVTLYWLLSTCELQINNLSRHILYWIDLRVKILITLETPNIRHHQKLERLYIHQGKKQPYIIRQKWRGQLKKR